MMRILDPQGTALRWYGFAYRRTYRVSSPNALWHIDSCHKLIRWRFVVHACVDGYSRLMTYAHCAETVLSLVENATLTFGIPSRVRSNHWLENIHVARFMLEATGVGRGSMTTDSSVHNQRIERLHRDVYEGVLSFYVSIFDMLEKTTIILTHLMRNISLPFTLFIFTKSITHCSNLLKVGTTIH